MTAEEVASSLVLSARRSAISLCDRGGALNGLPHAAFMGEAEQLMLVASSLIVDVLFAASFDYVRKNGRNVPVFLVNGLIREIGQAGDREFNGGFDTIWRLSVKELRDDPTAMFRITKTAAGDYARMKTLAERSCVEWALRKMNCGMIASEVLNDLGRFGRINTAYDAFCASEVCKIDLSSLRVCDGIDKFDLSKLPESEKAYDVFISYRRIDGDIFARLINQEFEHRGIRCFFDVERMGRGEYRMQILSSLKSALNFVFVMTEMSLVGLEDPNDPVRMELEAANRLARRITVIVPPRVSRDLSFVRLPSSLDFLRTLNNYRLEVGENFESSLDRVITQGLGR